MVDMSPESLQNFDTYEKCIKNLDIYRNTSLHYCVNYFNPDLAEYMLSRFPNIIDVRNDNNETPFYLAVRDKKIKMIRVLQKYSPDPSINTKYIENCYTQLIKIGDIELIKLVVPTFHKFQHFLYDALIRKKKISLLQDLLKYYSNQPNFDINHKCCEGEDYPCDNSTMIGTALCFDNFSMVKYLLSKGADIIMDDIYTLIGLLDMKNFRQLFIQLFKTKNLHMLKDNNNQTIYHYLTISNEYELLLELLQKYPVDLNMTDNHHSTLLTLCAEDGEIELTKYLLNNGANVNHKDLDGDSSIILSGIKGNYELIDILLKAGANIYERNNESKTIFNYLSMGNYTRCLRNLKKYMTPEILKECLVEAFEKNAKHSINYLVYLGAEYKDIKINDIPLELYIYYSCPNLPILKKIGLKPKFKTEKTEEPLECLITGEPIKYPDLYVKCDYSHVVLNSSLLKWNETKGRMDLTCQWCKTKFFNKYPYIYQVENKEN